MKRPFGRATWGNLRSLWRYEPPTYPYWGPILQAEKSIFMNHQPVRSILHVRKVYQAISPWSRGHCSPFMVNHPYIRPINQRNGNFPLPRMHRSSWTRRWHPGRREKGPSHSRSRKESMVCFCWGVEIMFERGPKKKQDWNDGIPGMKYIYYLYLVVRKWIFCSAPETKDIPIETCFQKRDNIF